MRVARIADQAPVAWRNGRGVTRDLGSGNGWRLSLAEIDTAGPFSQYPGLQRAFAIASGAVRLRFGSGPDFDLDAGSAPITFDGEDAPHCEPGSKDGACRALNLMVSRDAWRGRLERRALRAGERLDPGELAHALAVFVQRGRVAAVNGQGASPASDALPAKDDAPLAQGDAIFVHPCATGHEAGARSASRAAPPPLLAALDDDTIVIVVIRAPIAADATES